MLHLRQTCQELQIRTGGSYTGDIFPCRQPIEHQDEIDYSTILFLNPAQLLHAQFPRPNGPPSIAPQVLDVLGSLDDIRQLSTAFFQHIHPRMPFISKTRFYDIYLRPSFRFSPDVVLLFLSLKLITTLPPDGSGSPRSSLYYTTKHLYVDAEECFSLPVLQAGILLVLYELGHGLYPASFTSIGTCARYAHALGINVSRMVPKGELLTLVEVEERRRAWWAIVILDRFVSIGCPGRPFATADPNLEDLLPVDDAAWDEGIVNLDEMCTLSSPRPGHMSKFALLCQASRLLGHVLQHLSSETTSEDDDWMQIDRNLQSMLAAALEIDGPDHDQITFIYSTLVALHTSWLSPQRAGESKGECPRRQRATEAVQQISDQMQSNLIGRQCFLDRDPEDMSPWGLYFAYRICAVLMQSKNNTGLPHRDALLKALWESFKTIKKRWSVAGVYLQLLDAQQAMNLRT
ncbi:hypothetical protein BJY04DRAFT_224252 [Aspergillus karnatakaensis]|uniref:fungal specific transcription factor domain-containing protein n=1 Tax=Aspergillus karnatakaensis TaxID=1810916 RepID=UPI003CCCBF75